MSSSDSSPLGLSQWLVDDSDDEDAGDALQSNFQFDSPGSAAAAEASESSEDPEVRPLAFASDLTPPLQILQRQQQGIGFHLWPAAVFLCRCLEQAAGAAAAEDEQWGQLLPSPIEEASVLELGAGVGLVGLFCAALGAPRVVLSDLPEVLPALEENIALNADALGVQADRGEGGSRVQAMPLAWGTADVEHYIDSRGTDESPRLAGHVVVAADCIYWEHLLDPLELTLHRLCSEGATALLAQTRRFKKEASLVRRLQKRLEVSLVKEVVHRGQDDHRGDGDLLRGAADLIDSMNGERTILRLYRISASQSP